MIGTDHVMLVEELLSLVTMQIYSCDKGTMYRNLFWRLTLMKEAPAMGSLHYGKETTSRNVSDVPFITIFYFVSGI
jgi:hypothetical protein